VPPPFPMAATPANDPDIQLNCKPQQNQAQPFRGLPPLSPPPCNPPLPPSPASAGHLVVHVEVAGAVLRGDVPHVRVVVRLRRPVAAVQGGLLNGGVRRRGRFPPPFDAFGRMLTKPSRLLFCCCFFVGLDCDMMRKRSSALDALPASLSNRRGNLRKPRKLKNQDVQQSCIYPCFFLKKKSRKKFES